MASVCAITLLAPASSKLRFNAAATSKALRCSLSGGADKTCGGRRERQPFSTRELSARLVGVGKMSCYFILAPLIYSSQSNYIWMGRDLKGRSKSGPLRAAAPQLAVWWFKTAVWVPQTIILEIKIELAQTSKLCLIPSDGEIAADDSFSLNSGLINIVCTLSAHTFIHLLLLYIYFFFKNPIFPFHARLPPASHRWTRRWSTSLFAKIALFTRINASPSSCFCFPAESKEVYKRQVLSISSIAMAISLLGTLCMALYCRSKWVKHADKYLSLCHFACCCFFALFYQTFKRWAFTLATPIVILVCLNINMPLNTHIYRFLPSSLPVKTIHTRK